MASYIPGITDYIPQFQPFQPDYNFLGNILQNAQTKYDSNYKELSKTYGTLLNSPMSRQDNIQQRDEFFKMIDGDIKKISGMDLSLQQNVDSANAVYESIYKNKNIVHDMNYTREYQNQLQTGENYRNCIDQEKCGGKYSDEAMSALHYKQDEYKKATRQDALTMSPGRFTPFINIQEKVDKWAKDFLSKNGPFGLKSVGLDSTGRYKITTTNGAQLLVPLEQMLMNQYSQDQTIMDMFQTKSYVNRKSYVQQNAERFGGDENAAEDEYFKIVENEIPIIKETYDKIFGVATVTQAKQDVLAEEIKTNGSTGDDPLADDYFDAGIDAASAQVAVKNQDDAVKIANSIAEAGDDRNSKRQRIDALYARTNMKKSIDDSAIAVAAASGQQEMDADPYAKSYYDFSLDMAKIDKQHSYANDEALYKAILDISKQQALEKVKKIGSAITQSNVPVWAPGYTGTTAIEGSDDLAEITAYENEQKTGASVAGFNFATGYANTLMSTMSSSSSTPAQKTMAKWGLVKMYGTAIRDESGKVVLEGYDAKTNTFLTKDGESHNDPKEFGSRYSSEDLYKKATDLTKEFRSITSTKEYLAGDGQKYKAEYDKSREALDAGTAVWRKNNMNIQKFAESSVDVQSELEDIDDKLAWKFRFTKDGDLKTLEKFTEDYSKAFAAMHGAQVGTHSVSTATGTPGITTERTVDVTTADLIAKGKELAADKFKKMDDIYSKLYNEGEHAGVSVSADGTKKVVPLVEPLYMNPDFGNIGGGKTAGANIFVADATVPASLGTRGFITFERDVDASTEAVITTGVASSMEEASKEFNPNAYLAYKNFMADFKSGSLTTKEANIAAKVAYMDIAAGDAKHVGIHIKIPQSYLDRYKGKKDEPTWADDSSIAVKGIGVYIPKADANNDFTKTYATKGYDVILQHQDKVLSTPDGGTIKILKRAPDGTFSVQGKLKYYDAQGVMHETDVPQQSYSKDTGGENLVNGLQTWLAEIDRANRAWRNGDRSKMIVDPKHLPKIKSALDQAAGDEVKADMNKAFLERVQFNMANFNM